MKDNCKDPGQRGPPRRRFADSAKSVADPAVLDEKVHTVEFLEKADSPWLACKCQASSFFLAQLIELNDPGVGFSINRV
jgi:hypothetical protein